jgi:hypothetical protein
MTRSLSGLNDTTVTLVHHRGRITLERILENRVGSCVLDSSGSRQDQ